MITLILIGGVFFWVSGFGSIFMGQRSGQSELEVARSGLQTMKQMVGNQQAWSKSIQEEYDKLSIVRSVKAQSADYNYGDNFIGLNYSNNQVLVK